MSDCADFRMSLLDPWQKKRTAASLTYTERDGYMRCCGIVQKGAHRGEQCGCKMIFVDASPNPYFRVHILSKHKDFCEYDESSFQKLIKTLDKSGSKSTDQSLYKLFYSEKQSRSTRRGTSPHSSKEDLDGMGELDMDRDKEIKRGTRQARTIEEILAILVSEDLDYVFAGKPVDQWIVDVRNIVKYRERGLSGAQKAITVVRKTQVKNLPSGLQIEKGYYAFADAFPHIKEPPSLYFSIPREEGIGDIFFKTDGCKNFAIFGEWYPHPTIPHTFILKRISKKAIYPINSLQILKPEDFGIKPYERLSE